MDKKFFRILLSAFLLLLFIGLNESIAQENVPENTTQDNEVNNASDESKEQTSSERMTRRRRDSRVSPRESENEKTGLYISIYGGASVHQSTTAEFNHTSIGNDIQGNSTTTYSEDSGTFESLGIKFGFFPYRDVSDGGFHPNFGAELDFTYIPLSIDGSNGAAGLNVQNDLDTYMFMANLIFRVENKWVTPYMGIGFGIAYLDSSASISDSTGTIGTGNGFGAGANFIARDDQRAAFAFQAIGGLEYEIFHWLGVFMEYKFIHLESFDIDHQVATTGVGDVTLQYDFVDQHYASAGLRFKF